MRAILSNFLLDLVEQLLRPGSIAHSAPLRVCHGKYLKLGGLDLGLWTTDCKAKKKSQNIEAFPTFCHGRKLRLHPWALMKGSTHLFKKKSLAM
jgi:hypothetical protein